jgi:hypothetical protein
MPSLARPLVVRYTWFVTRALDAVIAKLAAPPSEEQDRIAHWLLDELRDEEHWEADRAAGRTTALDPDKL